MCSGEQVCWGFIYILVIVISKVETMFVISTQKATFMKKKISWENMSLRIMYLCVYLLSLNLIS